MRVAICGIWHLGGVTAASLAGAGYDVAAYDPDGTVIADLQQARPPIREPGLAELLRAGIDSGRLCFTTNAEQAVSGANIVWITFDTPVTEDDEPDVGWVRAQLEPLAPALASGALVIVSSQVPVGFTASLERAWNGRGLRFAYSPENLRLGRALESFHRQERVVVGLRDNAGQEEIAALLAPFCGRIVWTSIESAEMSKHALNALLATSVAFINEVARLCEATGADATEVERALRSEPRVGQGLYLKAGAAFAGGTLARDLRALIALGRGGDVRTPFFEGVVASNAEHKEALAKKVERQLEGIAQPLVTLLGLVYKPDTSTLRRSPAMELARRLHAGGVEVRAFDPAIDRLPGDERATITLCATPDEALRTSDLAVISTEWPSFRELRVDEVVGAMRRPRVLDPAGFLAQTLGGDARLEYMVTGKPARGSRVSSTP